jgi:hypothetical protein
MNLVPLSLATRHVYLNTEGYAPNARPKDRFNGLGRLMASLGGLYVMEDGAPRPLSKDELPRAASLDVRVTHECIQRAIIALRKQ